MNVEAYILSGAIESYVLGLATPEEREETDRYRAEYPEINAAILACEAALESNCQENAVPVGDDRMWDRIHENVRPEDKTSASPGKGVLPVKIIRPGSWRNLAAAAAVLLLISGAANVFLYQRYQRIRDDYAGLVRQNDLQLAGNRLAQDTIGMLYAQVRAITLPGVHKVELKGVEGKESAYATVYWNSTSQEVLLYPNQLPAAPQGRQYQLWALVDGKPVDAGILGDCHGFCRLKQIPRADAFAITLEKAGGSPTPDLTQLYVVGNVAG